MAIRLLRWVRRHPFLTGFLALFTYVWIKWMTVPPDLYLIHTFPWRKDALDLLVIMLKEDREIYKDIDIDRFACCRIEFEYDEISWERTSKQLPKERVYAYAKLMLRARVIRISDLHYGFEPIQVLIDHNLFIFVNYLYSDVNLTDCSRQIFEITGGMPTYGCTRMNEYWYLFKH